MANPSYNSVTRVLVLRDGTKMINLNEVEARVLVGQKAWTTANYEIEELTSSIYDGVAKYQKSNTVVTIEQAVDPSRAVVVPLDLLDSEFGPLIP